jgi:hypothetical protein
MNGGLKREPSTSAGVNSPALFFDGYLANALSWQRIWDGREGVPHHSQRGRIFL